MGGWQSVRAVAGGRAWSWLCRVLVVVGPQVALWSTSTWNRPGIAIALMVMLASAGQVVVPESMIGAVALALPVLWWVLVSPPGPTWSLPVASAALVAAHVAGVLLESGPAHVRLSRGVVRRWVARGALAWGAALLVWAAAAGLDRAPRWEPGWTLGALVLVGAVLLAWLLSGAAEDDRTR